MLVDIIVPVWTTKTPYNQLLKLVKHVGENTSDYRLILSGSSESQPKNINKGLEIAKSKYICILDWDVYVSEGWLDKLVKDLEDNPKIGIIGARMYGGYYGLNSETKELKQWPTLAGGCLLFRNIGLRWDENFPNGYWADTDFCRQYKDKGYEVWIDGRVEVEHDAFTSGLSEEGKQYYKKKWGDNEL